VLVLGMSSKRESMQNEVEKNVAEPNALWQKLRHDSKEVFDQNLNYTSHLMHKMQKFNVIWHGHINIHNNNNNNNNNNLYDRRYDNIMYYGVYTRYAININHIW